MLSIAELQPVLHDLFNRTADEMARACGFCRRARKLTGPAFAQALVFTLLENPRATLDDFAEALDEVLGIDVTPQAIDKRFTPQAADFLRDLFLEAFNHSFASARPALLPVLRRFQGVYLRDATLVGLPAELAGVLPGRGGRHAPHGQAAALKLVLEAEVTAGQFTDVSLLAGLDNERSAEVSGKPLPEGALLLEDTGFFSGPRLQDYIAQGVYVLTRVPAWTAVYDRKGTRLDLAEELRRRARAEARQRGRPVSQKKLDLCDWNILVTNAPEHLLSVWDAGAVRRVRWQVELVFKVFKSEGQVGQSRSACP